jgi:hypothetical protein
MNLAAYVLLDLSLNSLLALTAYSLLRGRPSTALRAK